MKPRSSLVAVDSLAAPASSQFGAPPFLPDGPFSPRTSPEPSGSVEDGDNFDSSIPPPDDCHMASNDNLLEDMQVSSLVTFPLSFHDSFLRTEFHASNIAGDSLECIHNKLNL